MHQHACTEGMTDTLLEGWQLCIDRGAWQLYRLALAQNSSTLVSRAISCIQYASINALIGQKGPDKWGFTE